MNPKKIYHRAAHILLGVMMMSGLLQAQTNVSGTIAVNTTWTIAGSPYVVTDNLLISTGIALTIQPGVIVKVDATKYIRIDGNMYARGTADSLIVFKSSAASPSTSAWSGIRIRPSGGTAVDPATLAYVSGSELKYVSISDAAEGLYIYNTGMLLTKSTFSHNAIGIEIRRTNFVVVDQCTFTGNTTSVYSVYEDYTSDAYGDIVNTYIQNSLFQSNVAGISLNMNQMLFKNLNVRKNRFEGNSTGLIFGGGGYGPRVDSVFVEDNIALKNLGGFKFNQIYGSIGSPPEMFPVRVRGNISVRNTVGFIFDAGGVDNPLPFFISNNIAAENTTGMNFLGETSNYAIQQNQIVNNTTNNIIIQAGYSAPYALAFSQNAVGGTSSAPAFQIEGGTGLTLHQNSIQQRSGYALKNLAADAIDAEINYWGTTSSSTIDDLIYDAVEDFEKGAVDYSPFLTTPDTTAPLMGPALVQKAIVSGSVVVSWQASATSDVAGYKVYYRNSTGTTFANVVDAGNVVSVPLPGALSSDTIAVTAYDTQADGVNDQIEGHESWFAIATPAPPDSPALAAPADGLTAVTTTPVLQWNASPGATTYWLQVAVDSLFSSPVFNDSTITSTSKQVGVLLNNVVYYWRVNAKNVGGTSVYSTPRTFRTILSTPNLSTPAHLSTNLSLQPTLTWGSVSGATLYRLQVASDNAFTSVIVEDSSLASPTKQIGPLSNGTTYYWRANASNIFGTSSFSSSFQFTTIVAAPDVPNLTTPSNGAVNLSVPVTLTWSVSARATSYRVQVATDSLFASLVIHDSTVAGTSKSATGLLNSNRYYWRVEAKNIGGPSGFGPIRSFITAVPSPTIQNPATGNKRVTVNWSGPSVGNLLRFRIYRRLSAGQPTLIDSLGAPATSYNATGLLNGQQYYFSVSAVNAFELESAPSAEKSAIPMNVLPHAGTLPSRFDTVQQRTTILTYSSTGSSDSDGTIDTVSWFVNGVSAGNGTQLQYPFGPGMNRLTMVVRDNDGGTDTARATITRVYFRSTVGGPVYAGLSMIGDDVLYAVASGDAVYRLHANGTLGYTLQVGGDIRATTSISYDTCVYIASSFKNLYAFAQSGTSLWPALDLGAELSATPAIDSAAGRLYLGAANNNFQAIDRQSGTVVWNFFSDAPVRQSPAMTKDRRLFFTTLKGTIYGVDLTTVNPPVTPTWTIPFSDTVTTSPAVDLEGNFYIGTASGKFLKVVISRSLGAFIVWQTQLGSPVTSSPVIDASGVAYVGTQNGKLHAVAIASGSVKWSFQTSGTVHATASIGEDGTIYTANDAGRVYALDSVAAVRWLYDEGSPILGPILAANGIIYVGSVAGKITAIYDRPDPVGGGNARFDKTLISRRPIWGTFQGNTRRNGVQEAPLVTSVVYEKEQIPTGFALGQNYPNPFNPTTLISYRLPVQSAVRIRVLNLLGQVVDELVNEEQPAGERAVVWRPGVASGVYLYTIEASPLDGRDNRFVQTRKMILLK